VILLYIRVKHIIVYYILEGISILEIQINGHYSQHQGHRALQGHRAHKEIQVFRALQAVREMSVLIAEGKALPYLQVKDQIDYPIVTMDLLFFHLPREILSLPLEQLYILSHGMARYGSQEEQLDLVHALFEVPMVSIGQLYRL